jgi:hypothetical protein
MTTFGQIQCRIRSPQAQRGPLNSLLFINFPACRLFRLYQ